MTRARDGLLMMAAALCLSPAVRAAEPVKDATTRHNYDFTQPEPGEILPNPKQGVGTPPALRDYVTVHKMSDEAGQAAAGSGQTPAAPAEDTGPPPAAAGGSPPAGSPATGSSPPAGAAKPARDSPSKAAAAPSPAVPSPSREAPVSPAAPSIADYVRLDLAEQVAAKGVAGPFAYRPSPATLADPARKAAEEAAFERDVAALAASWQAWQRAHPSSARPLAALPSRPSSPIVVEARPGRLVLSGAPASVTGDFPSDALIDPAPERPLP